MMRDLPSSTAVFTYEHIPKNQTPTRNLLRRVLARDPPTHVHGVDAPLIEIDEEDDVVAEALPIMIHEIRQKAEDRSY